MKIKKIVVTAIVVYFLFLVSYPFLYTFLFKMVYSPQWRDLEILIPEDKIEILSSEHARYFLGGDEYLSDFIVKIDKVDFNNFVDRLNKQEFFDVKPISNSQLKSIKKNVKKSIADKFDENSILFFTYGEKDGYNYQFNIYASSDKSILYISSFIWK